MTRSIYLFATLASAALVVAPAASTTAQETGVAALAQRYLDAQRGFDPATLAAITADDFIEISPVGEVDDRAEMLSFYAPDKKTAGPAMTLVEPLLRQDGDSATLIAAIEFAVPGPDGTERKIRMRATYAARKAAGKWRLTTVQYTPIRG